jgi:hypothetical protein
MKKVFFILVISAIMIIYSNQIQAEEKIDIIDVIDTEQIKSSDDFYIFIDSLQQTIRVEWEQLWAERPNTEFLLIVEADGNTEEPFFREITTGTSTTFSYSEEIQQVSISLYHRTDDFYTLLKSKELDLIKDEFLKQVKNNENSISELELTYNSLNEQTLVVVHNGRSKDYSIQGEGTISIALKSGKNNYQASFEGENKVIYSVSGETFYNTIPPSIDIYDELYGKSFMTDFVIINGRVENGSFLTINGQEVKLDQQGEFAYEVSLQEGENRITFFAKSDAGVSSFKSMILVKESKENKLSDKESNIVPILFATIASLVVIVISIIIYVFLYKKK